MDTYKNPVIKGFHPDPSICRNGEDFYLVTSSFEFFPGVPIYHSKNLTDWTLINYCLTRDDQLHLTDCPCSGGIYAPTIRYHAGVYYMTTTNVSDCGNFIVHTNDITGGWSLPQRVRQDGIDPSLYFEGNKAYFCSTQVRDQKQCIGLCEINPLTGEMLTDTAVISYGSEIRCPESPHIYKINGLYYLLLAEGGTEYRHRVTIFRSPSIYGPYEACPRNPILSHSDYVSPIQATGHGDLIQDQHGNWWMVCLGIRTLPNTLLHNLGRETFLAPVAWDDKGWPAVNGTGKISLWMQGDLPAAPSQSPFQFEDCFERDSLDIRWNFIRNPVRTRYSLSDRKGFLKLSAAGEGLNDMTPAFLGIPQPDFNIRAITEVSIESGKAGMTAFYNKDYHYEIYAAREGSKTYVALNKRIHDMEYIAGKIEVSDCDSIGLRIDANEQAYSFYFRVNDGWQLIGTASTAGLCTEGTMYMTFTGTYIGLFAQGGSAYFIHFTMEEIDSAPRM